MSMTSLSVALVVTLLGLVVLKSVFNVCVLMVIRRRSGKSISFFPFIEFAPLVAAIAVCYVTGSKGLMDWRVVALCGIALNAMSYLILILGLKILRSKWDNERPAGKKN